METVVDAAQSGVISVIIAVVITVLIAQVVRPPWRLEGILLAVAVASFFSGLCSRYFAPTNDPA
jgi:formate-dependent nitrite reductase membrane component NrfD